MTDIILATHGSLANGLKEAAETIMGPIDHIACFHLTMDKSIDVFTEEILQALDESEENVIVFTDLLGASPFNATARGISEFLNKNIVCITGVNLPMVLECVMKRDEWDVYPLSEYLLTLGKDGITDLSYKKVNEVNHE